MADDGPGSVTDELYTVDPSDFVAARTALVRRLRAEKRRELAAEVAALRRPSPAAWAVNQLVRGQRADVEALVALGEGLRTAQAQALSGSDAADLRTAARARRDAVAALTGAAARLLATRGGGVDAHLSGVTATLEAASLDPDLGALVLDGRLSAELEPPSGFGDLGVELAEPPAPQSGRSDAVSRRESPTPTAPDPVAVAARARDEARRRSEELAAEARAARHRAERLRQGVQEADAEVARLRRRLEAAEDAAAAAKAEADAAGDRALVADRAAGEAVERLHEAEQRRSDASG